MNVITRGIRNAFRNRVRTLSIVVILGLSIGLSLAMLIAHQAVNQKIKSVKNNVGNTITISPAGFGGGFGSGGNPLTQTQLDGVKSLAHVSSVTESLTDRLTNGTNTNLQSAVSLGSLGQRFGGGNGGGSFGGNFSGNGGSTTTSFTPPVTAVGTTDPTELASGGGPGASSDSSSITLKSGKVFDGTGSDNVAIIGSTLAAKNNLKVGSTFTAYGTNITVVGIYDAGTTFGNNEVILPLATEQKLSSQTGDITSAKVTVDSVSNLSSVTSAIKNKLGSSTADVTDDETRAQDEIQPLQDVSSISLYSLVGAVVAGGVIVLLTMVMIVRERRREIGIFKALGASNAKVMFQFMSEAVTLTVLGAIIGIILGVVAGNPITKLLVDNSTNSGSSAVAGPGGAAAAGGFRRGGGGGGFGFVRNNVSNIHAAVGWSIIIYGLVAAVVIALIGSAAVSYLISKVRPAEVMRSE